VVRISTMTEPYHWHSHPNSDEMFLVVEGGSASNLRTAKFNVLLA